MIVSPLTTLWQILTIVHVPYIIILNIITKDTSIYVRGQNCPVFRIRYNVNVCVRLYYVHSSSYSVTIIYHCYLSSIFSNVHAKNSQLNVQCILIIITLHWMVCSSGALNIVIFIELYYRMRYLILSRVSGRCTCVLGTK